MDLLLVNGRYSSADTEKLLTQLVKVKTDFHQSKIDLRSDSEEDIKHSERRIKELEEQLHKFLKVIHDGSYSRVALRASLKIEFVPDYYNV